MEELGLLAEENTTSKQQLCRSIIRGRLERERAKRANLARSQNGSEGEVHEGTNGATLAQSQDGSVELSDYQETSP